MKSKLRLIDILPFIASFISVVFVIFVPAYSTSAKNISFNSSIYTIFFITVVGLYIAYFFYEFRYEKLKINKLFAALFLYLIIANLIVTLVQPSTFTYKTISISISFEDRWFGICAFSAFLIGIYYFIFIFPKKFSTLKVFSVFSIIMFLLSFVGAIYSYIAECNMYAEFFKNIFINHSFTNMPEIHSFYAHHNTYAMVLITSLFSTFYLYIKTNKRWLYFVMVFLAINVLFTSSLGGLLTTVLMIFCYVITRLIANYKNHKKTVIIISSILGVFVLASVVLLVISVATNGQILSPINDLFQEIINGRTSKSRIAIWKNCIILNNDCLGWIFGRGFITFAQMLYPMNVLNEDAVFSAHNSVFDLIGTGGIIMLIIFVLLAIKGVSIGIKNYKSDKTLILTILVCSIPIVLYTLIETNYWLILYCFYPLFLIDAITKDETNFEYSEESKIKEGTLNQKISLPILLVSLIPAGIVYPLIATYGVSYIFVPFVIFAISIAIQIIIAVCLSRNNFSLKIFFKETYLNLLIELVFICLITLYMYLFKETDIAKGIITGLMFAIIAGILYLLVPQLKNSSGYCSSLYKLDRKVNQIMNI